MLKKIKRGESFGKKKKKKDCEKEKAHH